MKIVHERPGAGVASHETDLLSVEKRARAVQHPIHEDQCRLLVDRVPVRVEGNGDPVRRLQEQHLGAAGSIRQGDVPVGGEVELGEDDLAALREVDTGHDGGQCEGHVNRDGQLLAVCADESPERVLEPPHLREDVLHPDGVGRSLGRPHVHVVLQIPLRTRRNGSERSADQIRLRAHDRELVSVGLEVDHVSCFSR